ncbi:MAG: transcriptional repressor [Candidatus Microthrix sp.]|nr:transcriptional repressor [Candidatus Microthrix sp.]MBK9559314.1 transcriptional repressor [Candidatus Microthrix sp.]
MTAARRLVLTELATDPGAHISAEDLADRLQGEHPELHLATVYRTLRTLGEVGLVQPTWDAVHRRAPSRTRGSGAAVCGIRR